MAHDDGRARTCRHRRRLFYLEVAVVIAAVCALRATSLYAHDAGTQAARALVRSLPPRASVVVYSAERLALSGPGVKMDTLPPGFHYRFEYQGFRLLLDQAGTYYLLLVGWSPRLDITYVLSDTDPIRVELVSSVVRSG